MEDSMFRYDIKGLCEDIGVSYEDIYSLYLEYFSEMKGNIQECKALCESKAWDRLEREVHNMKGISINLNITDVYTACNTLDYQLRTGEYGSAFKNLDYIYKLFDKAENDIKEFFKLRGNSI